MYLCSDVVKTAFARLRSRDPKGKVHLERTSALMVFLAFSALVRRREREKESARLDFPPKSGLRTLLAKEFRNLVRLEEGAQVSELGSVEYASKKEPESRLGSNFLTSTLKKASIAASAMDYPSRPRPLLRIGKIDEKMQWGIELHADWKANLPTFFCETIGKTPFTDLAIFVLRYEVFDSDSDKDVREAIFEKFSEKFPAEVSEFFKVKMASERVFAKHLPESVFDSVRENLAEAFREDSAAPRSRNDELRAWPKELLVQRIISLEKRLADLGVDYEKI